jgi:hypothetical protein
MCQRRLNVSWICSDVAGVYACGQLGTWPCIPWFLDIILLLVIGFGLAVLARRMEVSTKSVLLNNLEWR